MKGYNTYCDSDIQWLGQMPVHWTKKRLKSVFSKRSESYNPNEELQVLSLLKDVGVIPYSEKGNIGNRSKEDITTYNIARRGDVVMNSMNVIIGSVDITPYDGYISPAYYALYSKMDNAHDNSVVTKYFNYLFHLKAVQQQMRCLASGILEIRLRLSTTKLFGMYFPFPPVSEQEKIVAFLENSIRKIDSLSKQKEKEIDVLEELKRAEISKCVTHGLNEDVKMKSTGIPWIGNIPEHWNMVRIKHLLEESKRKSEDGHELSLSLSKTAGIIPYEEKENRTMQSASLIGAKIVEKGDVVFNRFRARLFAISGYDGVVSPDYAVYKGKGRVDLNYLVALFSTEMYRAAFDRKASGIGDGFSRLYTSDLFSMYAIVPPKEEQKAIMAHLDYRAKKIESMISSLKEEIECLTEYKQRLIFDVVTGRINVQE